jgi:CSLREA domain-containing protein
MTTITGQIRAVVGVVVIAVGLGTAAPAVAATTRTRPATAHHGVTNALAATTPVGFQDLGLESAIGDPIRVNDSDEVLTDEGVWRNGTFTTPNLVNNNSFDITDMSADGTVVGSESSNAAYWDSRTTQQPQDATFACPGIGTESAFFAVDSADEAAGASNCQISGQPDHGDFTAFLPTGSDNFAGQPFGAPQALQPNWETGFGVDGTELLNRTTGVDQQMDALNYGATASGVDELAPDGTFAGDMVSPPAAMQFQAGYQTATGMATALPEPADVDYSQANAINATDQVAGIYDTPALGDVAAVWPTPTSAPTNLNTLPQVPVGWFLDNALSINDQGDVLGTGDGPDNDEHVFLMSTASLVVNSAADDGASDPTSGLCMTSKGECTLRAAIQAANVLDGKQTITFAIPGGRPRIVLTSTLPAVSGQITIDGDSEPGTDFIPGVQGVEVVGSGLPATADGLDLTGGSSTVTGLDLTGFGGAAISLQGGSGDTVSSDSLGDDQFVALGAPSAVGNGIGVEVASGNAQITDDKIQGSGLGDPLAKVQAQLSGLGAHPAPSAALHALATIGSGIAATSSTASGLTITDDTIGAGTQDFKTYGCVFGILLLPDTGSISNVTIGGTGVGNTISGNVFGIESVSSPSLTVSDNLIGPTKGGHPAFGNLLGVTADSSPGLQIATNTIQDDLIGAIVSGSAGATGGKLTGNTIGVSGKLSDLAPDSGLGGRDVIGVVLHNANGVTVGGAGAAHNSILGAAIGVMLEGSAGKDNVVAGNTIGLSTASGTVANADKLTDTAGVYGIWDKGGQSDRLGIPGAGNTINDTLLDIASDGTTGTQVQANQLDGSVLGVAFSDSSHTTVGGAAAADGNTILDSVIGLSWTGGEPDAAELAAKGLSTDIVGPATQAKAFTIGDAPTAVTALDDLTGADLGAGEATLAAGPSPDDLVENNHIGVAAGGGAGHGNLFGVSDSALTASMQFINNTVAHNEVSGVMLGADRAGNTPGGVTILHNSIFDNARRQNLAGYDIPSITGLGIDLLGRPSGSLSLLTGPNPNHAGGEQAGAPNGYENYPDIATANPQGSKLASAGSISTDPNSKVELEFFTNAACNVSGYGEGETPVGTATVTTDGSGNSSYAVLLPHKVSGADRYLTATATLETGTGTGDTSEFSACQSIQPAAAGVAPLAPTVTASGELGLQADCGQSTACTGTLTLTGEAADTSKLRTAAHLAWAGASHPKIALGKVHFRLKAHGHKKLVVRLSKKARKALAKAKSLTVTATLVLIGKHHKKTTRRSTFVVFAPKKKK